MKLAYAVSAIRVRSHCVDWLEQELAGADLRVYWDDPPSGNSWSNYRKALLDAGKEGEDVLVVMDDDAWPCINFTTHVNRAIESCPSHFASFYVGSQAAARSAREAGASWISTVRLIHGICWAVPVWLAKEIVYIADALVNPSHPSGDQRLLVWLLATGRRNFISVPNIVNHRRDVASVMDTKCGKENARRRAACYDANPIGIEWPRDCVWVEPVEPLKTARRLAEAGTLAVTPEQLISGRATWKSLAKTMGGHHASVAGLSS